MTNTEIPNKNPDKESILNRSKTNGEDKEIGSKNRVILRPDS